MNRPFPASRADALASWQRFLPQTPRYGSARNLVTPGHANVSRLSPAIGSRLLLEDEIIADTLASHSLASVEKWVQEICWRRYWKGWLECRPGVWRDYQDRLQLEHPASVVRRVEEVAAGRSGVAVMDRFARELVETGYLHNHARMWFASFWIHVEKLPWELGAHLFHTHLLDADAASNTCSWRWVAGLQTAGKTYLVRRSNLEKFCAPEYLKDRTGLDRLDDDRVSPASISDTADTTSIPLTIYPDSLYNPPARWGLWIHEEDLAADQVGPLAGKQPASVFRSAPVVVTTPRKQWWQNAAPLAGTDLSQLTDWAMQEKLTAVVAYAPFVGPLQDRLLPVVESFVREGITLLLLRRKTDQQIFPLGKKGFFPFWQEVRKTLSTDFTDFTD